jgi:transposase
MVFLGVDVHKSYLEIATVDGDGRLKSRCRIENAPESIDDFVKSLDSSVKVAMESCSYFYPLYNRLEEAGIEVKVAHPLKVKLIAESKIKSDRIDSLVLAQLYRMDYLPTSYVPPREIRHSRDLLRHRIALVRQRTQVKNRIHHLLEKNGVKTGRLGFSDIFGKSGLAHLHSLDLPAVEKSILAMDLDLLEYLNRTLDRSDGELARMATENPQARLLMTIPGVDYYTALLLLMEIGDVKRFPNSRKLCCYAGLVPGLHQSGEKTSYGRITKQGNKWIRYIIVEAVGHTIRHDCESEISRMYERIKARKGASVAKVACARKLMKITWFMLTRNEPYRYSDRRFIEMKERRMERRACKDY